MSEAFVCPQLNKRLYTQTSISLRANNIVCVQINSACVQRILFARKNIVRPCIRRSTFGSMPQGPGVGCYRPATEGSHGDGLDPGQIFNPAQGWQISSMIAVSPVAEEALHSP